MATKLKDTAPFTADDLKGLVTTLEKYNKQMWDQACRDGRQDYAIQYNEVIQTFIEGIYYVWERYGYGWADELADENGIDGIRYMLFHNGLEERIEGLLNALQFQNIFEMFDGGDKTRNTIIKVYTDLLKNLKLGKINF